jgi:low affinity Fe/Cu permease
LPFERALSERKQDAVGRFARLSSALVASPWAPVASLLVVGVALYALPPLGIATDRVEDVALGVAVVTLLLVFLLEHNEQRDTTAIHVKLDEILLSLSASKEKVGAEDLPPKRLERMRDEERERAAAG